MSFDFEKKQGGEFAAAPGSDDGTVVGPYADGKVGFYGTDPIARINISSSPTVAELTAALVSLGLVTQD